jgi:hypothetical protein
MIAMWNPKEKEIRRLLEQRNWDELSILLDKLPAKKNSAHILRSCLSFQAPISIIKKCGPRVGPWTYALRFILKGVDDETFDYVISNMTYRELNFPGHPLSRKVPFFCDNPGGRDLYLLNYNPTRARMLVRHGADLKRLEFGDTTVYGYIKWFNDDDLLRRITVMIMCLARSQKRCLLSMLHIDLFKLLLLEYL